ncbi:MAG TPA: aromatic ring-hydroxylating dioxygenase subunit alpha [Geminicoccaceae bacterium]
MGGRTASSGGSGSFGDALSRAAAPIERARGLPNACYADPAMFEREKARVFATTWTCIASGRAVPAPGDALPVDHLGIPLLLLRDKAGALRVFHNVCSHRGMVLVSEPTRCRSVIRCPYHSWCYNLDGSLKATPHVGGPGHNAHPALDRRQLGLKPVRSAVWLDLVFVDLSGTAPDFEDHVRPLRARWHDFADRDLHHPGPIGSFTLDVRCNWKLAVENYCESYHLPWVHPGLNSYSRLEDHYTIVEPGAFSGQGTRIYNPLLGQSGRRFPSFPDLPEVWDQAAEYIALYPNVLLGAHKDHLYTIRLEPRAADRTLEHVEIYFATPEALEQRYQPMRDALNQTWREVFEEDVFVVEGMQTGRTSPAFDGGVFSPAMEAATHGFHRWVAERLAGPDLALIG